MKSLRIIQIISKILYVLCIVLFVLSIIGAACCAIGLIVYPLTQGLVIYQGKTIGTLMAEKGVYEHQVYTGLVVGLLSSGVGIFLSRYNSLFFKEEIDLGTPFEFPIVHKMRRVALVNIIVSIALAVIAAIVTMIIQACYHVKVQFSYHLFSEVGFGLALLIISLFCEYGAEVKNGPEKKVEVVDNVEKK